ncbi:SCO2322 family protein [Streptomyces sparsogenes]|uniref:SCO2322 family protein n=1 Tax=Streptomyces sparsogenes TaxID=67365 RepID=UPI00340940EB
MGPRAALARVTSARAALARVTSARAALARAALVCAALARAALVCAALAWAALALGASPAHAEGYRYWSFWQRERGAEAWAYATQGPATARPGDGDTVGFRFAVSEDSRDAARPRGPADFKAICADTPAKDGAKRVAVVLDFGTAADAPDHRTPPKPRTECARVGEDASAADALAAVAKPLRYNSAALLCAIAGYPATGCGEQVDATSHGASGGDGASGEDGGHGGDGGGGIPSAGLIGGLAAVVALGAAAVWQARRHHRR